MCHSVVVLKLGRLCTIPEGLVASSENTMKLSTFGGLAKVGYAAQSMPDAGYACLLFLSIRYLSVQLPPLYL